MTIEVLICSFNAGIVKVTDTLLPPHEGVRYIVSFQYTEERFLNMVPRSVQERPDVSLYKYHGQGLSTNRNQALTHAKADVVLFVDDDTHLLPTTFCTIEKAFKDHPDVDIAFFCAASYTGRPLKAYPKQEYRITKVPTDYHISVIEMAFRRERVQGNLRFDERFGLGTRFLTCGEEDIWLHDALTQKLQVHFFPITTVETSTMMKHTMLYVDAGVQRSFGAYLYYVHGALAWWFCLRHAFRSSVKGYCHFFPMLRHFLQGAHYIRKNQ